jgi:hypothetical protein
VNQTRKQRDVAGPKQDEDLRRNPGIGQSVGTSQGGDFGLIEGENTVEGDIDNNAGRLGEVKKDMGRTNKWLCTMAASTPTNECGGRCKRHLSCVA